MIDYLIPIFAFLLTTSILVAFHEYGHYKIARLCGVKVLNFSIGFGPKLYKTITKSGTEFSLSAIPLGGYVKMLDEREADVPDDQKIYAFNRKASWQKLAIVIAGPFFNFILAFIAFYFTFLYGVQVQRPVIQYIEPNSLAEKAGIKSLEEIVSIDNYRVSSIEDMHMVLASRLGTSGDLLISTRDMKDIKDTKDTKDSNEQDKLDPSAQHDYKLPLNNWYSDINKEPITNSLGIWMIPKDKGLQVSELDPAAGADLSAIKSGDIITGYNNQPIDKWDDFLQFIKKNPDHKVNFNILRNNKAQEVPATIGSHRDKDSGAIVGFLGINFKYPFYLAIQNYGFLDSVSKAFNKTIYYIGQTFYMLYKLAAGQLGLDTIRGPIMVGQAAGMQIQISWINFLDFLAIISIGLGVINLLPIPVLDGGHVVYHLYEMVSGKQMSQTAEKIGLVIGVLCLLIIMSIAMYNDIIYL